MTYRISSLDQSEEAIEALNARVLRILGKKTSYSDTEYLTALAEASETDAAIAASIAATGAELTPDQEARLRGDVLHAFAQQRLREKKIAPDLASYEEYSAALAEAQEILEQKAVV